MFLKSESKAWLEAFKYFLEQNRVKELIGLILWSLKKIISMQYGINGNATILGKKPRKKAIDFQGTLLQHFFLMKGVLLLLLDFGKYCKKNPQILSWRPTFK